MSEMSKRLRTLERQELTALRAFHQSTKAAQTQLKRTLSRVEAERERLAGHEQDPEVLVRTGPGPTVEIFHDADDYCGRVNPTAVSTGRFERLLLFEAEERGLRPCSACAWHLRSRRRPNRGAA